MEGLLTTNINILFSTAPVVVSGVRHKSVKCNACRKVVCGIRWKCAVCNSYDLCSGCYMSNKHELTHAFFRIDTPRNFVDTSRSIK